MPEPSQSFAVVDVTSWYLDRVETIGSDEKYWLIEPETRLRWLFKPNNTHITAGVPWTQREDYSEKIAGELARRMEVPAARIELAVRDDVRGCISLDLKPDGWELQTGQVLLDGFLDNYVPGSDIANKERKGHSLENIDRALKGYVSPPGSSLPGHFSAFDAFAGYVIFDAVVANRDRHDENWAVMRSLEEPTATALAGSFDHARALGSSLRASKMAEILGESKVERWVVKGTAWRFEHQRPRVPTLVEVAGRAAALVSVDVREYWRDRVADLDEDDVVSIISSVPELSEVVGRFVRQVVAINRRRVLDGC